MALSNYIPSSRLAQSGVCTSTTRPASPFEGQMIYETDTNRVLVWDNSAWVMIADTDQPPGLQLVKTQTVGTGVSTVTVNDAFSSEFDNYRIIYSGGVASNQANIWIRVGALTTNYFGAVTGTSYFTSGVIGIGLNNGTVWYGGSCGTAFATVDCDIFAPNIASRRTLIHTKWFYNTANDAYSQFVGETTSTSQYTSFTLLTSAGTLTGGNIRVYGYRN